MDDKLKILLCEDDENLGTLLSEYLQAKGFQADLCPDGEVGYKAFLKNKYDICVLDVMMPKKDGFTLAQEIRQANAEIPIIFLTAKQLKEDILEGFKIGADDYITKPFSIAIVKAKIQNALRIRKTTIEHYTQTQQIVPKEITNNALDEELLSRAIEIVNQNLCNTDFSTERFAREMLMSRSNLPLKLKALTGESTNDFIRRIRFNKACALLKEGRLSVSEISYKVGFNSPSYFATSFKKRFGCMPTEYGKQPEDVQP